MAAPEQELPIDIHLDKFIEWLESRNKIAKKQWQTDLKLLVPKVKKAVSALPDKINQIFKDTVIDYWTARRILQMLEKTKTDSGEKLKGLFGSYSDATLQEWDAIIKSYEKNNIHLAESARALTRNVNNDIPSIRSSLQTADKQISDLMRRCTDSQKTSKRYLQDYDKACQQLGVQEGTDLREGINNCKQNLGPMLEAVKQSVCKSSVEAALHHYRAFAAYSLKASFPDYDENSPQANLLPTTQLLFQEAAKVDLADTKTRQAFLSDLMELSSFFEQRVEDLASSPVKTLVGAPAALQVQSQSTFEGYVESTHSAIAELKSPKLQQLIMLNQSERYVERTVLQVEQSLKHSKRLATTAKEYEEKREKLLTSSRDNKKKLAEIIKVTKELKGLTEGEISKMYNGRKVNLFGDIASL